MLDPITHLQHQPIRTLSSIAQEIAQTLFQLLLLSLLLLGIGGIAIKTIGSSGWLPSLLSSAWDMGAGYLVAIAVGAVILGAWLNRLFYGRPTAINRYADMLVIGCLGLGAFFALRLVFTGTL